MARKTSSDLRKEYNAIIEKQLATEARIRERARQMTDAQPNVIYTYWANQTPFTVKEAFEEIVICLEATDNPDTIFITGMFLKIIAAIEEHNLKAAGIVQKTIYDELNTKKS